MYFWALKLCIVFEKVLLCLPNVIGKLTFSIFHSGTPSLAASAIIFNPINILFYSLHFAIVKYPYLVLSAARYIVKHYVYLGLVVCAEASLAEGIEYLAIMSFHFLVHKSSPIWRFAPKIITLYAVIHGASRQTFITLYA